MPPPYGDQAVRPSSAPGAARGWDKRGAAEFFGTGFRRCADAMRPLAGAAGRAPIIIAVTGLAFEARIAGGATVVGPQLRNGERLAAEIARGGRGIISFGIGGALTDDLLPGQCIVAGAVVTDGERHRTDDGWSRRILRSLPGARHGNIAGNDLPVADPIEKRALHARTGALLVDTETHHVARIAVAHGIPFAACRIVVDPVHRYLPPGALLDQLPDGRLDRRAILRSVLREPGQLGTMAVLAFEAAIARAALRQARMLLGADLGFPYVHEHELGHAVLNGSAKEAGFGPAKVEPA